MDNYATSKIVDIEGVTLMIENGSELVLKEVRYVSKMHLNLISAGKLDEAGML